MLVVKACSLNPSPSLTVDYLCVVNEVQKVSCILYSETRLVLSAHNYTEGSSTGGAVGPVHNG